MSEMTVLMEVDLIPGSFLYIPRGFVHEASTNCTDKHGMTLKEMSVHVTLGIEVSKRSSMEHFMNEWLLLLMAESFDFNSILFQLDSHQIETIKDVIFTIPNNGKFIPTFLLVLIVRVADSDVGEPLRKPLILSQSILKYTYFEQFETMNSAADILLERSVNDTIAAIAAIVQFINDVSFNSTRLQTPVAVPEEFNEVIDTTNERMGYHSQMNEGGGVCNSVELLTFLQRNIYSLLNSIFLQ
eukprot:CAMPEP_0170060944 /NCGR_PEP_ID=MMETSP0019_2-20121128/2700_1 /TAXON_ID=98059 /ORGANISM="Dinobryon sp., Strain UTEXLB2267" /LENGTH=241 /DNA_ID=CAMNT_0010266657 /DNA_START=645 /DNA_END=1367 /DNA_ORIENTATION=+